MTVGDGIIMNQIKVIRGAICAENTAESISENALTLVKEILTKNCLSAQQVSAVFFSATHDLNACYPAKKVRETLLPDAAFMCFQEMAVDESLPYCIRVAVFAETEEVHHCYLGKAAALRLDLQ